MNLIKLAMYTFFIALIIPLIISADDAHAASCNNCTVTITSDAYMMFPIVVTLELFPSGSIPVTTRTIYSGQTVTISVPAGTCPLRLTGRVINVSDEIEMNARCPGDGGEGLFISCSKADCNSSTWLVKGYSGGFHFVKQ